jgi:hypothetical protein
VHGVTALERTEHGLGDANVGFDPRHDELVAPNESFQPVQELGAPEAAEAHLVQRDGRGRGLEDFRHRRAQSPAVLRGEDDGQAEDVGELEEEHAVAQDAVAVRDGGEQLLLKVHDDQRRALGMQQPRGGIRHRVSHGRVVAQARTASCISSRWPEKKWSASDTTAIVLGSGSRATESRRTGPGPNTSFAPCTNRRGRAHASRKEGSFTIDIGKPRATSARTRASAQPARRAITEPNEKPAARRGRPGKAASELVEGRAHVVLLAASFVVDAFAAPDAAEVEPQGGDVLRLQSLGHAEDDLEVHDPALEGMGMADDGGGPRRAVREHEDRFEEPRRPREVEGLVGRHEGIMQDVLSQGGIHSQHGRSELPP